jgi:hypothetical protein
MRYPLVIAITGASGTVYAQRLLQRALEHFDSIGLANLTMPFGPGWQRREAVARCAVPHQRLSYRGR